MGGIIGPGQPAVIDALDAYASTFDGELLPEERPPDDGDILVLSSRENRHSVLFPYDFLHWDHACGWLSGHLKCPVFSLHIHDGDFWMTTLFDGGEAITGFNPIPDYWGEISDEERGFFAGNAAVMARHVPGLDPATIERYLVDWNPKSPPQGKAYPDDKHSYGEEWQMVDLMGRLGLEYPIDVQGYPHGLTFRFDATPEEDDDRVED